MFRDKPVTALALCLALLVACASTTLTSTWRSPEAQAISLSGKSIGVVFVTSEESLRRTGENALALDISARGARGFGTYLLLPGPENQNVQAEAAQARLKSAGADAVVMMRVVGEEQRITYTPGSVIGPNYRGFGPYWTWGWRTVYQPGYLRTDTLVAVETLVYSLPAEQTSQLLWASTSRTTNPNNIGALVREVADANVREMVRQGFLAR
jgi:hypothetical protein